MIALPQHPLICILRGLEPSQALLVAEILYEEGFRILEVPLNSPSACISIEKIKDAFQDKLIVGAGTVLTEEDVADVAQAGGQIILSPNCNEKVIQKTKALNMLSIPGVFSPTEAFSALNAGANGLKFFPCEALSPQIIKAYKAVLPQNVTSIAVGGIDHTNMQEYIKVGISGFGFGSSLFKPNMHLEDIRENAKKIIHIWQYLSHSSK